MSQPKPLYRLDRSAFTVVPLKDQADEGAYWQSRTPEERMQALECLRRMAYGDAACSARLQAVFEVAQRSQD